MNCEATMHSWVFVFVSAQRKYLFGFYLCFYFPRLCLFVRRVAYRMGRQDLGLTKQKLRLLALRK